MVRTSIASLTLLWMSATLWPTSALGQKPPEPAAGRTITDSAGRRVRVPDKIRTVFAAGGPATIVLYTLAPDRLAGWNLPMGPEEKRFIPSRYHALPQLGRLTGRAGTANIEVVLRVRPDLILDVGEVLPTYISLAERVQAQTGTPYVIVDGSLGKTDRAYELLGDLLGEPIRARELATYFRQTMAAVEGAVARSTLPGRPRVYYAFGPKGLESAGRGSVHVEVFDLVGALNVMEQPAGAHGRTPVSMEQVLRWDPEVIVTLDPRFFETVFSDPAWQHVAAVKQGRVYLAPTVPFPWIDFPPSVNRIVGIRWLAAILYPEVYREDLPKVVREFYARFYHYQPTEAEVAALLRPPRGAPR